MSSICSNSTDQICDTNIPTTSDKVIVAFYNVEREQVYSTYFMVDGTIMHPQVLQYRITSS